MPRIAKVCVTMMIGLGALVLLLAASAWSCANPRQFVMFLALSAFASALKVRIPGLEATLSPNFVFLILGMTVCSLSEVTAMALVASLVQSLWGARHPRLVQVAFSAATLAVSAAVARESVNLLFASNGIHSPAAFVILAGSVYFSLNSSLVSAVIGLVEGRQWTQVVATCCDRALPYLMGGMLFAGLVSDTFSGTTLWMGASALVPVVLWGYWYSLRQSVLIAAPVRFAATVRLAGEEPVAVGSYVSQRNSRN
jgi:hypothetical protein